MSRRIISTYILKEAVSSFLISLFAFTAILLTLNMLKFASLIINKGVGFTEIAMVFISLVPTFLEFAIPMSTLLGVMLAFARMSGDSELVVMRASGISLSQLILPILYLALTAGGISLFVSQIARPWGYSALNQTLMEIASTKSTAGLDEGVFSKLGDLTIYSEKINHDTNELEHVLIDDKRNKDERKIVVSKRGVIEQHANTNAISFHLMDGVIHEIFQGKYSVTDFNENTINLDPQDLLSDDASKKGKQFSEMSLGELKESITAYSDLLTTIKGGTIPKSEDIHLPFNIHLTEDQISYKEVRKRINRAKIEYGRRFSMPIASIILTLVGMALGVQPPRTQKTWGVGLSALFGLGVFVLYYGVLSIGMALSESGTIPPVLALWLPNLAVSVLAAYVLYQLSIERWHSVNHGIDILIAWVKRLVPKQIQVKRRPA